MLARTGLASLLAAVPEVDVLAHAAPTTDIAALIGVYQPQIILWDIGWSPDTDLDLLAELLQADGTIGSVLDLDGVPVVALTTGEAGARALWDAGVRAILLRSASLPRLVAALTAASEQLIVVDEQLLGLFSRLPSPDEEPDEPLTSREMEVLQLLAQGMANKTIARTLGISEHTVKFHVNAILSKLGAQSRTDAVVRASRAGLVIL